jgi:hypothetical protein
MKQGSRILSSAAVGTRLTYLLDPVWGKRRRALLRDKVVSFLNQIRDANEF